MKFYRYLYYRFYTAKIRNRVNPEWSALICIYYVIFSNICTVLMLLEIFSLIHRSDLLLPKPILLVVAGMFLFVCYRYFVGGGRAMAINKEFSKEDNQIRLRNTFFVWPITIAMILLPAFLMRFQ